MGRVTVTKSVEVITDVDVEIDAEDLIGDISTEELREELANREEPEDPDNDPLARIWQAVTYQGVALEDVVEELMRERAYRWPPQRQGVAA